MNLSYEMYVWRRLSNVVSPDLKTVACVIFMEIQAGSTMEHVDDVVVIALKPLH